MGGTLVFRGTRVPAQTLFDYLDDGYTLAQILEIFPSIDANDAVEFLRIALSYEPAAPASEFSGPRG